MKRSANGIVYIRPQVFNSRVEAAFLTRTGGVSQPPFESLNFDLRDGDAPDNVERNRALVAEAFGLPIERLVTVSQVHGDTVFIADGSPVSFSRPEADAVITDVAGLPVGMLTADCLPILIHDPVGGAVAAVHAGWKGTAKGIAIKTVKALSERFGSRPEDLRAALGPHIGPCCYPVGEGVKAEFSKDDRLCGVFQSIDGSLRLDIGDTNRRQLISAGLREENISGQAPCTSCDNRAFFSYRKDGGRTGRQLSFLMLR